MMFHPKLSLVLRLIVGGVLLFSSWHKITDPPDFAKIIFNYKLFPESTINLIAIFFPWLEAAVGGALILGISRRGAAILAMLMFTSFIVVLSYNLSRGCPTICGCFGTHADGISLTVDEKFYEMKKEIWLVDVPCLLLGLHVFLAAIFSRRAAEAEAKVEITPS